MPESAVVRAVFPSLPTAGDGVGFADVLPVGVDREASRAAGFAAGFAAGARAAARAAEGGRRRAAVERAAADREAAARIVAAVAALETAAAAARARTAPVLDEATETLHRQALELARAVLGVELRDEATAAAAALARVRAAVRADEVVEVRLHPDDVAALAGLPELPVGVLLVADTGLRRGEAVAEHREGWLDGRIEAAFDRALAVLEGSS